MNLDRKWTKNGPKTYIKRTKKRTQDEGKVHPRQTKSGKFIKWTKKVQKMD